MQAGTRLGPYAILEPLGKGGKGGMGEVWLAEDTRLGRRVAIKVLPEHFAGDPERLARFEQEARAAAALNHPHIAAVYDVGTEGSPHYMVQEFLEGESLRELLQRRRALPLDLGLRLAGEIAQALRAAHAAGIVHRDLKPENVFVTRDNHAKVLDFGLAKLTAADPVGESATISLTKLGTVAGVIMGTPGYMAPEQVNGDQVDARADLFAFGCLLYEIVTGQRAFAGDSIVQTLSKIVHEQPEPLSRVAPDAPAELQRIVRKCLAKQPGYRYQGADDLAVDLTRLREDLAAGVATAGVQDPSVAAAELRRGTRNAWTVALPIAAVAFLLGAVGTWMVTRPAPPSPRRFDLAVEGTIPASIGSNVAISPQGDRVAYVTGSYATPEGRELRVRPLDRRESTLLVAQTPITPAPYQPFFSPDGLWVGFVTPIDLRKIPVAGGPAVSVATVERSRGADWGSNDTIVYAPNPASGLYLVSASGGNPEPITEVGDSEYSHRWPQFLPGGSAVLFTAMVAPDDPATATIEVVDLANDERTVVHRGGTYGRYVPTGHLVYASGGTLFARPFDVERREATGPPVPVLEDLPSNDDGGVQLTFSNDGTLIYSVNRAMQDPRFRLAWVNEEGTAEPLPFEPRGYSKPRLSPQGDRIAVAVREANQSHIWILDLGTGTSQRLTDTGRADNPIWSPDGAWVYFGATGFSPGGSGRNGEIWRRRSHLGAPAEPVYEAPESQIPWSISADGSKLMFTELTATEANIGIISLQDENKPRAEVLVVRSPYLTERPWISPDGRMFAFQSNETGINQIYVQDIETQGRRAISTGMDDNTHPVWSRDGSAIFYRSGAGQISVVDLTGGPPPVFSSPRRLFDFDGFGDAFDVSSDGRRLLGTIPADLDRAETTSAPDARRLDVILNWFEQLAQQVPTRQ